MSSAGGPSIPRRDLGLPAFSAATFVVLAIALSLFQLYISGVRPIGLFYERAFHLAVIQVLAFLLFPTKGRAFAIRGRGEPGVRSRMAWTVDAALIAGSIFAALYLTLNLDAIVNRAGAWSGTDVLAGGGGSGHAPRSEPKGAGVAHFVHRRLFHRLRICGSRTPRRASAWRLQHRTAHRTALSWPGGDIRDPVGCGRLLRLHLHPVRSAAGGHGRGPVLHRPGVRGHRKTKGWHFLVALVVLMAALLMDFPVARVGFLSCLAVAALAALRATWDRTVPGSQAGSRPGEEVHGPLAGWVGGGIIRIVDGFVIAGRNALPVSLACAVAGIIVGIVGLTGLGLKFSALMLSLSQGNLILALILLLLASLVLGMGLPVTASYVVLIVLAGPVLINDFGLPVLIAHLLVFWYSQDSNVTPPVCLAAYAAAGVAGSDPMRTGLQAWKYAKGLYLIPLLMGRASRARPRGVRGPWWSGKLRWPWWR